MQWNFDGAAGVNALGGVGEPDRRRPRRRPRLTVAVLDTGVAYATAGASAARPTSPPSASSAATTSSAATPYPNDHNGHGTHVAGTIGEVANNRLGLTGLAYGASIIPVRVLDREGEGRSSSIASGIRYAARRGADVINLSFEFRAGVSARRSPTSSTRCATPAAAGRSSSAASGNEGASASPTRRARRRSSAVGATTEHRCRAYYSNDGAGLDLVAPGGGDDADGAGCLEGPPPGRDIFQITLDGSVAASGCPEGYKGTSMAAPHVSAAAALVIASGVVGRDPAPRAVERRLRSTAADLGPAGYDERNGWGLLDAGAATAPGG